MIRSVLYIVTLLFLSSCSRSIYYAFEEEGTYCTFEEKKNGEVIYRAVSKEHYKKSSSSINYLHIYSNNDPDSLYLGIGNVFTLSFLRKSKEICMSSYELSPFENFINYTKRYDNDSLSLLMYSDKKRTILKEPCFAEHKITWFPPYLKKVKKIDYKKFNLPLKEKYLKTMADKDK